MRIATWNVNSITARLPRLLAWLESSGTDVLCLQEAKVAAEQFPTDQLRELGYEAAVHATGRWNGVAVISRVGLEDVVKGLPGDPGYEGVEEPRAISATCGPIRVWSVYVPNGREVDHPHYAYKLQWFDALRTAVAGDATGNAAVRGAGRLQRGAHGRRRLRRGRLRGPHPRHPGRARRAGRPARGGPDRTWSRALKYDHPYTYWDYRQLCFPKNRGMRIDLVYGNETFSKAVTDSYVDREERKGKGASDHAPVVVDLDV